MTNFCWVSPGPLPRAYDLRRCGWERIGCPIDGVLREDCLLVVDCQHSRRTDCGDMRRGLPGQPEQAILAGIPDPQIRAALFAAGYGDVLGDDACFHEFAVRARRVVARFHCVSRHRIVGRLRLDLLRRDAQVEGTGLSLHPREFEMLWYLAGIGARASSREELLREVWNVRHEPETNSVAVHAFRIRAKLSAHGLREALATDPDGSYRLRAVGLDADRTMGDGTRKECRHDQAVL